ncbi:MAG: hypothetical protein Q8Q01_02885 [archaeon]|nr:hypothetical protein [archaeon]
MDKTNINLGLSYKVVISILIVLSLLLVSCSSSAEVDDFATCLTESGALMYGAFWCPHCIAQKNLFGKSFNRVTYIECSLPDGQGQTEFCTQMGIESYPTWEFANEERITGELTFTELAEKSECPLPVSE